jgi:hypothetical protein
MTPEQTPAAHASQRDWVRLSLLMEDARSDRRDMPRPKPLVVVPVRGHVFVIPVVTETGRLL